MIAKKNGVAIAAFSLVAVACSHDTDFYDPSLAEKEYVSAFSGKVMDGNNVDAVHTWNTSVARTINVQSVKDGTVKVFATSPMERQTAPLATVSVKGGELTAVNVACPQDVQTLYVVYFDADLYVIEKSVKVDETAETVTFGVATAGAKKTRAAFSHNYTFPDGCDDSKFVASVPTDAVKAEKDYNELFTLTNGHSYYIRNAEGEIWGDSYTGKLYIDGTCSFDYFALGAGVELYLVEGAKLTLTGEEDGFSSLSGIKVYVSDGATLDIPETMALNQNVEVYSKGKVNTENMNLTGSGALFYNYGELNVNGNVAISNGGNIVNEGTFKADSFDFTNSGQFLNNGTTAIAGTTLLSQSDNNVWINDGHYTTGDFDFVAGNGCAMTNCNLTVNNLMTIQGNNSVTFQVDGSVVTKDLVLNGYAYIEMAANSLFKVTDTATFECYVISSQYGFKSIATGSDYAVLQAGKIVKGIPEDGIDNKAYAVKYAGNLIVDSNDHFAQGDDGSGKPFYEIDDENTVKMAVGETRGTYSIAESNCNPGYNHVTTDPEPKTMYYYYAFEDLGATDDFDFNDVVLGVTAPVDGVSDVYLMAAGGTLSTVVTYNGNQIGNEVHGEFGVPVTTMVNTKSFDHSFVKLGTVSGVTDASALDLAIVVSDGGASREIKAPAVGATPLMIRVAGNDDGKWFWPSERTNITSAYNGFGAWGASYASNTGWYKIATGSVIRY